MNGFRHDRAERKLKPLSEPSERIALKEEDKEILVAFLQDLCKLPFTDYNGNGTQKPQVRLLPVFGSSKFVSTEGGGIVILKIVLNELEIDFKCPNHVKNHELLETFTHEVMSNFPNRGLKQTYKGNDVLICVNLRSMEVNHDS